MSSQYSSSAFSRSQQHLLTPRSKVKALLASIDDESSSENEKLPRSPQRKEAQIPSVDAGAAQLEGCFDSNGEGTEEESDGAPIIPRGRLAARLFPREGCTSDSRASSKDNVYERIKHQIIPKAQMKKQPRLSEILPATDICQKEDISDLHFTPRFHRGDSSTQSSPEVRKFARKALQTPQNDSNVEGSIVTDDESASDLPAEPQHNEKLKSLVAQKRDELRIREMEKSRKASGRKERALVSSGMASALVAPELSAASDTSGNDQVGESKLTQQARPTRKASKKALQEMNRETQRMSRNMQLAHQAKTRKKITKESFFSRFTFQNHAPTSTQFINGQCSSTVASSAQSSDKEAGSPHESPPTSPLRADDVLYEGRAGISAHGFPANKENTSIDDAEATPPRNFVVVNHPSRKSSKRAMDSDLSSMNEPRMQARKATHFKIHHLPPLLDFSDRSAALDSESDIEIVPRRNFKRSLEAFDRQRPHGLSEERPLQTLRALAHLNSPGKKTFSSKPVYTMSEMQVTLQRKARKQAAEERATKIQYLKSKGVIVQSAEERERDQVAIEDLLETARQEAALITQREKDAARKEKLANGNENTNDISSDEDEDFEGDDEDDSDTDFSGSDDDQGSQLHDEVGSAKDERQTLGGDEGAEQATSLKDERNSSSLSAASDEDQEGNEGECHTVRDETGQLIDRNTLYTNERRSHRATRIIEEDDDEDNLDEVENCNSHADPIIQKPFIPGLAFSDTMAMGMTQAFAATMADLPSQVRSTSADFEQDSLHVLGPMPEPDFPVYGLEDSHRMVLNSQNDTKEPETYAHQPKESSTEITTDFPQPQLQYMVEETQDLFGATQFSEIPDPTQDVGFEKSSPMRNRFVSVPPSTVDTIILSGAQNLPVAKKKGRLHRRTSLLVGGLEMSDSNSLPEIRPGPDISANAFDMLKKGAEKSLKTSDIFDKQLSKARPLVEEQAQESEDEYAGLGGASDEESTGEVDEETRKMIDEEEIEVDERELAAFHANKERARDEKAVEKLFKDLNSGALRRKRGADFEISDSDDDGEARRRAKRREFAKMRKALFENENIGKIAEDPKKLAFLRAIEDREHDENYYLFDEADSAPQNLDNAQDDESIPASQAEANTTPTLPTRPRPLQESLPNQINRSAPASRRSRAFQKPTNLADIRASLSFLLEDPHTNPINHQLTSSPPASDTETSHHTRPPPNAPATTVIDRLSLKRAESATTASTSSSSRLAFFDPAKTTSAAGFKPPSLLRRATTSNLLVGGLDSRPTGALAATERAAGGGEKGDTVRMGGSRKSSVGYFARGRERGLKRQEEKERRRKEGLKRRGMEAGGLRALATGTFD